MAVPLIPIDKTAPKQNASFVAKNLLMSHPSTKNYDSRVALGKTRGKSYRNLSTRQG
jgi:hypothetical protein